MSRYDDVVGLLRDTRLTSGQGVPDSLGITGGPLRQIMDSWMMALDGEPHTRTRRLISRAFTPRAVESLEGRITEIVDELLERALPKGRMELLSELAYPLPARVICALMAAPSACTASVSRCSPGTASGRIQICRASVRPPGDTAQ